MSHYPHYPQRRTDSLDGIWQFAWLGETLNLEEVDPAALRYTEAMAVPGAFDAGPKYAGKRGIGVYRKQIDPLPGSGAVRLKIGGMGLRCRVFWDGREIAFYETAYSAVDYDLEPGEGARHELVIAADNRFVTDPVMLLRPNYDFYCYGGIYRSVELQSLPPVRIERVEVTTPDPAAKQVRLKIRLGGELPDTARLAIAFDDGKARSYELAVSDGIAALEVRVPHGKLWSPAAPHLHTVTVSNGCDTVIERFGIRSVEAKQRQILLNGKPVKLFGFCRHEAHPELGPALPPQIMIEEMEYLRELGANFIRTVHYPQSQLFFDLCDELGFLVWEEALGWGDVPERLGDPHFIELQKEQTLRMARESCNHPSIIIHAFLNEGASQTPESDAVYRELIGLLRREDPSRLISYASDKHENDRHLADVDLIAFNIYPGWFTDDWEHTTHLHEIAPRVEALAAFTERKDLADKPVIFSEIGCCGLYNWRDRLKARWSEEYQAEHMAESLRVIGNHPRFSGVSFWQFYDTRTFANGGVRAKANGFNNAGVLDAYRRPKLAFDALKTLLYAFLNKKS